MTTDKTYESLVHKMQEVASLPPQTIGPLTPLYRTLIPYVKDAPWRWFMVGSFMTSVMFYILFGALVVKLVSLLQYGF
jgi:hypothetical protein